MNKILVIDRERDVLKTLETILRKEGYEVRGALGKDEAVETFKSRPFDLVIMDINIPEANGLKLMRSFKKADENMEVIILTGSTSIENALQALRDNGAFEFLSKPLENVNQLITSVKQAMRKQALKMEKKVFATRTDNEKLIMKDEAIWEIRDG